jgi:hypothetical protein
MRLIAFILSSAIALASIPASASAASNTFRATSVSTTTCPVYEGYPDCHPDGAPQWSLYSSSRRSGHSSCEETSMAQPEHNTRQSNRREL